VIQNLPVSRTEFVQPVVGILIRIGGQTTTVPIDHRGITLLGVVQIHLVLMGVPTESSSYYAIESRENPVVLVCPIAPAIAIASGNVGEDVDRFAGLLSR